VKEILPGETWDFKPIDYSCFKEQDQSMVKTLVKLTQQVLESGYIIDDFENRNEERTEWKYDIYSKHGKTTYDYLTSNSLKRGRVGLMVDNVIEVMNYYPKEFKHAFKSGLDELKRLDTEIRSNYIFKSTSEKLAFVQHAKQMVYSFLTHLAEINP
jgi:hypothetical protein